MARGGGGGEASERGSYIIKFKLLIHFNSFKITCGSWVVLYSGGVIARRPHTIHLTCSEASHQNRIPLKGKKFCPFSNRTRTNLKVVYQIPGPGILWPRAVGSHSAALAPLWPQSVSRQTLRRAFKQSGDSLFLLLPDRPCSPHCPLLSVTHRGCPSLKLTQVPPRAIASRRREEPRRHACDLVRDQALQPSSWPP